MIKGAKCRSNPLEFCRQIYFDTPTHSMKALEYLIFMAGINRVVLGSDHPFEMGDGHLYFRKEMPLGRTEKQKVETGNALKLLSN
jgi:aminocarboxymuconate-semialdehyde decarboxylase